MLIFLGGTMGKNEWQVPFIQEAVNLGIPASSFINPRVPVWNDEVIALEAAAKRYSTHLVFGLADPMQEGNPLSTYSCHEAYFALSEDQDRTVVFFDTDGMSGHAKSTMDLLYEMFITEYPNAAIFKTRDEALIWLAIQAELPSKQELVFMDGTVGNNGWRQTLLRLAGERGMDTTIFFNPVVADWNAQAAAAEEVAHKNATIDFFYLGDPQQAGNPLSTLALVKAQRALRRNPEATIVVMDATGMTGHPAKSLNQIRKEFESRFRYAKIFETLEAGINALEGLLKKRSEKRSTETQEMIRVVGQYSEIFNSNE